MDKVEQITKSEVDSGRWGGQRSFFQSMKYADMVRGGEQNTIASKGNY